uniref:Uncharacterized protein n=1 Tax=Anguilla anguilla TaxID=7936 RepID=A0A0E9XCT3_ANGAN
MEVNRFIYRTITAPKLPCHTVV